MSINVKILVIVEKLILFIGNGSKNRDKYTEEGDFNCITNNGEVYGGLMPLDYISGFCKYLLDPKSTI